MSQSSTPSFIRAGLPTDPSERRAEYLRRYTEWWRRRNPSYSAEKNRAWRAANRAILAK